MAKKRNLTDKSTPPTGAQIKAARALLGWSGHDLASRSGIAYATAQRAESSGASDVTLMTIKRAMQKAGVLFLDPGQSRDGGPGVRLK